MSVRIEVKQTRTVDEGPIFKVDTQVTYASGIAREIFVFETETQDFSHVATTYDMETYPDDRDTAIADGVDFYRKDQAIVVYALEAVAVEAASYTLARIDTLARQYNTFKTEFEGSSDYVFTEA